jgi:aminopeptidase N
MDEGFATYAEGQVSAYYYNNLAQQSPFLSNAAKLYAAQYAAQLNSKLPLYEAGSYTGYIGLAKTNIEEPMTTHADHYNTNYAYSHASYSKGAVFLCQLGYIISDSLLDKVLMEYYNQWKFKHPNPNDFIRVAEKLTGIELQWYKEYWINGTKTIDYAVGNIDVDNNKTYILLKRLGKMPMPIDVLITYKDGTKELHYIPLSLMYGTKPNEDTVTRIIHDEWKWVAPEYKLYITKGIGNIKSIEIDPSYRMADMNRSNNKLVIPDY